MDPKKNNMQGPEKMPAGSPTPKEIRGENSLAVDETVSTRVSEVVGELSAEATAQSGQSQQSRPVPLTPEEKKAKLLESLPKEEQAAVIKMKKEITHVVEGKLSTLEKSAKSSRDPYKLTLLMREIHNLRDVLAEIVNATFEYIQALWLRLVHGLTI